MIYKIEPRDQQLLNLESFTLSSYVYLKLTASWKRKDGFWFLSTFCRHHFVEVGTVHIHETWQQQNKAKQLDLKMSQRPVFLSSDGQSYSHRTATKGGSMLILTLHK